MSRSLSESTVVPVKRARRVIDKELKNISSLDHFPNEIFLLIFEFLDLYAIVNAFSGINKHYDSLLSSLKSVTLAVPSNGNVFIEKNLRQYSTSIVYLVMDRVPKFTFTSVTLTNVRSLTIKCGTQIQYDSVRPCNFPLLEYFHLEDYPNPVSKKSIYNLYQVILSNGFPQLRKCIAQGPPFDSNNMASSTEPSKLCSFQLAVETAHDFNMILSTCPHLHRIHVSCFGLQQEARSTVLKSQTIVKHLELKCNHPSTPKIFLSSIHNIVTLKLVITAWPTHDLFEQLAADFKLSSLQALTCLVAASQTCSYPMSFETLSEHYIKNLHPLFKYVTIKQNDNAYCVDGDDVEWNKYDFQMRYSIHESVEIKSFM
ncbi:unnamed protein product [Rotaria magnacalcarata]|nr:unnamed protein product [Rotaria magnacalcarata]CAF4003537.1 unnamed protein product [Rotaria magnacalcarata]